MRSLSAVLILLLVHVFSVFVHADISFVVVGDWGGMPVPPYTLPGQVATAAGMGKIAAEIDAAAVLALGDNFYTQGVQTVSSKRFENTWDSVYSAESLQVPWLILAGNHDHYGNVTAEVEYSSINKRWVFPDLYHTRSFVSEDGVTVDVIMIDTVDLSGTTGIVDETDPRYFDKLPARSREEASTQWAWIEEQMQKSTAEYLIVAGHYPVYSICEHGNTQNLIDNLKPLLVQYGAHYLAGHDHCQVSLEENGVSYMVTGTGDTCCYSNDKITDPPTDTIEWYISGDNKTRGTIGGFSTITATAESMTFVFRDQDGIPMFTKESIPPRSKR